MKTKLTRLLAVCTGLSLALLTLGAVPASADYSPSPRSTWSPNGTVYAITMSPDGQTVYIGGRFTSVRNVATGRNVARSHLAAFDAATGDLVTGWSPSADDVVRAIAFSTDAQTMFVGGDFLHVNNAVETRVAALDLAGSVRPDWSVSATKTVKDLLPVGDDLFLAGRFSQVNGKSRKGLAKVDAATGGLFDWNVPTVGGRSTSIVLAPNGQELIAAGSFTSLGGQPRNFAGAVDLATGNVSSWNPASICDTCNIFDLAVSGDYVYGAVGGGGGRAAKWSATTGNLIWTVAGDGDVQAIAVRDGIVYAGGHYGPTFGRQTHHQLAQIVDATGTALPWAPNFSGNDKPGIWAIDVSSDFLRIGGGFRQLDGVRQARVCRVSARGVSRLGGCWGCWQRD